MAEHSAALSVAGPVSTGTFHAVDGTAKGTVALFHKPDGTFAITFEDFSIASNAHTNVILVTNRNVTKDGDIDRTAIFDLGLLTGTSGNAGLRRSGLGRRDDLHGRPVGYRDDPFHRRSAASVDLCRGSLKRSTSGSLTC